MMSGGTSELSHGLAKEKHSEEREIQGKGKRVDTEEWEVVRHKEKLNKNLNYLIKDKKDEKIQYYSRRNFKR